MRESGVNVKICGVTNVEDALACASIGVEMLGLNFSTQSLRAISRAAASEIVPVVRSRFAKTKFVGVFLNQDLEFVRTTAKELALDAVQLHGEETPEYLHKLDVPFVIKAFRAGPEFTEADVTNYKCDAILLDSWSESTAGGTGETFPWAIAARLRARVGRLILAGGLTSANVARAIEMVQPFAVDVCSGVEKRPGQKDHEKVRRFLEAARNVPSKQIVP
jgi:phosphoribosylanthranilate isomerase